MKHELQTIDFYQDTIFVVDHAGEPYVPLKPICENIGLDWKSQHAKLTGEYGRFSYGDITTTGADGKQYKMLCLPLKKLNGWLMTISPSKVNPEIKDRLISYQNECDEVLWNYWTKGVGLTDRQLADNILIPKDKYIDILEENYRLLLDENHQLKGRLRCSSAAPVTEAEIESIRADILAGLGTAKTARKYGRARSTIMKYTAVERAIIKNKGEEE